MLIKNIHGLTQIKIEKYGEASMYDYIRKEVLPYVKFMTMADMKRDCDVELARYGYTHDVGFNVVIKEHGNPNRDGRGWRDLDREYRKYCQAIYEAWEYNNEYGYH